MSKIGILGAGTWGVTLANLLVENGHKVIVWSAIKNEIELLQKNGKHPHLSNIELNNAIKYTEVIKEACKDMDIIIFAVPSPYIRDVAIEAKKYIDSSQIFVNVSKGMSSETLQTLPEIIIDELQIDRNRIVTMSGPTHAEEVIMKMPTKIVAAGMSEKVLNEIKRVFTTDYFEVYESDDMYGVCFCGALKNVIALSVGIAIGAGCGDNMKAAIITEGMKEIKNLGERCGCKEETFYGLAGIGDLIVTATSVHSRNYRAGILIGEGKMLEDVQQEIGMTIEGIYALNIALELAKKVNIELPIMQKTAKLINGQASEKW